MTRSHANILRVFCLWTVFVWVTRIRNIWGDDRSFGFKAVHTALAVISVVLAGAAWWVVTQNRGRNVGRRNEPADSPEVSSADR